ncbi:hypothetical protein ACIBEJ_07465 [Nonomuraea sp. NPDC050790]|uniref:hypothetical protein n=1 Tax=Nonomuraea sp. NPDC050790 TaxID=3364371 RepID=UPI0037945A3C
MTSQTKHQKRRPYVSLAGAAVLTAGLTLVLGAGAATAAERPGEAGWAAVVKPALNCPQPKTRAAWNVVRARVAAVGDLTGDGGRETVVVSSCPSPTASNPLIAFVYDGAAKPSNPRLLGALGKNRYFKSLKVTVRGGRVHLHGKALSDAAPRCCPDLVVSQTYRWDGKKLRRTAETVSRAR